MARQPRLRCSTEALTYGEDHPPGDGPWITALGDKNTGHCSAWTFVINADSHLLGMSPGVLWCSGHGTQSLPWQKITKWMERSELRSRTTGHPFAAWTVLLSCGHANSHVVTDIAWRPEHGHTPTPDMVEKVRPLLDTDDLADSVREYIEQRLPGGWPEPQTGQDCAACAYSRRIISWQPIGPLTWPGDDERPSRAVLTRRIRAAEAQADQLREQLARAEAGADELRSKLDLL